MLQGLKAVWSPHTGIVDWAQVTEYYAKDFKELGGQIHLNFAVSGFQEMKESTPGQENKYPVRITGSGKVSVVFLFVSLWSLSKQEPNNRT